MARASTRTLLSLDRFAEIVSFSPILFSQVYVPEDVAGDERAPLVACSDAIMQYTWQALGGGLPSREEIALAIRQAEDTVQMHLHFSPMPQWYVDETVLPGRMVPPYSMSGAYSPGPFSWFMWGWQNPYQLKLQLQNKYPIYGGVEAWSVIAAAAPIVYSDPDNDGYNEKATVIVNTTITDPDEIAVYYPSTLVDAHDPSWEIRPINVSISAGVATITFKRHQCVLPELLETLTSRAVNGMVDPNFLTEVDVYRHYNDPSQMAVIEWSPAICDENACEISAQAGCFAVEDWVNGIINVHAADWDATTGDWTHVCPTWWQQPTRVRLWVRGGYRELNLPRPMNQMRLQFEQMIAFLALTYMDREWTSCEPLHNLQARWRTDLAVQESGPAKSVSWKVSRESLDNPIGTTRAAVNAWQVIRQFAVGQAVTGT